MNDLIRKLPLGRLAAVVVLLVALWPMGESSAQRGQHAKVYVVQGRIPRLPTQRALLGYGRSHNERRLQEIDDVPLRERRWQGNIITQFSRPLGDVQFTVVYYDVTDGDRRIVGLPMEVFVNDRDESVFVQPFRLERPTFRPGRKIELSVTIRRAEVGKARFELVGEVPRNTGVVNFE
jgi:hypothetical protein